jgi:hypothetical protein
MKTTKPKKKAAPKQRPEKDILKGCLEQLKIRGILHWRQNSGMVFIGKRMIRLGSPGLPDIFAVMKGTFFAIELKTATGKLRPAQEDFRKRWESEDGCIYILARSESEMLANMADYLGSFC